MGSCLDINNLDCVEVRGCTAFSFTRNDQVYHGRDNDLPPFFKKISKSIYYRPQNGNCFILNTSSFINLTDRGRKMVVVECNPARINIRYPEKSKRQEDFIITVDHFTSKEMWKHDASDRNVYFSEDRYQTVYNALMCIDCSGGVEHAKNILSGKHGFICQYDKKLNFDTIWASVVDVSNNKLYRAEGNPSRTTFKEDLRF